MKNEPTYHSYLIRLWQQRDGNGTARWGGELTHIQSGQKYTFPGLDQLFLYLHDQLQGKEPPKINP